MQLQNFGSAEIQTFIICAPVWSSPLKDGWCGIIRACYELFHFIYNDLPLLITYNRPSRLPDIAYSRPARPRAFSRNGDFTRSSKAPNRIQLLVTVALLLVLNMNNQPSDDLRSFQQSTSEPNPSDAIEGILNAFDEFPIVALDEAHGLQQEADFIAQLRAYPKTSSSMVKDDAPDDQCRS
jgi:hypothetical protein